MPSDGCLAFLKSRSDLSIPGYTLVESARAICRSIDYLDQNHAIDKAVEIVRTSHWPGLNKAVEGGMQHVISVDNAASYAELWSKGGNWYAVTGATMPGDTSLKKAKGNAIYEVPGLTKGMGLEEASARFLNKLFGAPAAKKAGCAPCGR